MWFLHESLYLLRRTIFKSLALLALLTLSSFLLAQLSALMLHPDLSDHLWLDQVPIEIYLEPDPQVQSDLIERAKAFPELELVDVISAEDASNEFAASYGLSAVELLGENPFPTTLRFQLRSGSSRENLPIALQQLAEGLADYHVDEALYDGIGERIRRFVIGLAVLVAVAFALLLVMLRIGSKSERSAYRKERHLLKECGATPIQERLPEITWQVLLIASSWGLVFAAWHFEVILLQGFDLRLQLPLAFWFLLPTFNLLAFQLFRSKRLVG